MLRTMHFPESCLLGLIVSTGIPVSSWMIVHLRNVLWILFPPRLTYMFGESIVILNLSGRTQKAN